MIDYSKQEIKEALSLDDIFALLTDWGAEPEYSSFGIICSTICHNMPGEGSRKLYYYVNNSDLGGSGLFRCYTGCDEPNFDILELTRRVFDIQEHKNIDLNEAVRWIAQRFGIIKYAAAPDESASLEDWKVFSRYEEVAETSINFNRAVLKEYDQKILGKFNYNVKIVPWLKEGISQESMELAHIGFYAGGNQITIPHYDVNNRLIGIRGRTIIRSNAEQYGKYRPITANGILYSHSLGMNLYGINWAKDYISKMKKAIIFESEKSVLLYSTLFGKDNLLAVACCGSSFSAYQFQSLLDLGAEEIIIAFDRDFEKVGDNVYDKQVKNLLKIRDRFGQFARISYIFDKRGSILPLKASPIECGRETFLTLFKNRIVL